MGGRGVVGGSGGGWLDGVAGVGRLLRGFYVIHEIGSND